MNLTATCRDCGLDVTYNDHGFWPWRAIDGSDTCREKQKAPWGHRVPRDEAELIYAEFQAQTGRLALHARWGDDCREHVHLQALSQASRSA